MTCVETNALGKGRGLNRGKGAFFGFDKVKWSRSPGFSALKGPNMIAQGIALGIYQRDSLALKGRNNL